MKKRCPLLIPVCLYTAGIAYSTISSFTITQVSLIIAITAIIYFLPYFKETKSLSLLILIFMLGICNPSISKWTASRWHFSNHENQFIDLVIKEKQNSRKGHRYIGEAKICFDARSKLCQGRLIFNADSSINLQKYNTYRVRGRIYEIDKYLNPGRFDYGRHLAKQNINHRLVLDSKPIIVSEAGWLKNYARKLKENAKNHFDESFKIEESSILINAVLLGDRADMNPEFKALFTNNGLAHLLAISGMHVGIVLLIMTLFASGIPSRILKTLVIVTGIWFYIMLTGLQVPAIRAGLMFTIYTIGHILGRNTSALNSIFLSALLLLSIDYSLLFQLSFQLSYMAMLSILLFYKYIFNLVKPRQKFFKLLWQLLSLNISVQILILPICIYYFHQFPTYSIVNSILSTPFILVIMWGATGSLLLSKFTFLAMQIDHALEYTISVYIDLLEFTSSLPFALLQNIDFNLYQLSFWILCALALLNFLNQPRLSPSLSIACFSPFIIASSLSNYKANTEKKIIIYDDPKQVIIEYQEAKNSLRWKQYPSKFSYQVESNQDTVKTYPLPAYFEIDEVSIAVFDRSFQFERKLPIDVCVVKQKPKDDEVLSLCSQIILPRVNNNAMIGGSYSIKQSGAFVLKL